MSSTLKQIAEAMLDGLTKKTKELTEKAVAEGIPAKMILDDGLLAGMQEVGVLFKEGELFVPEVLIAAKAMNMGMEVLAPLLGSGDVNQRGIALLATVQGDLHDVGLKLVGMMLKSNGYEIINLGIDVATDAIVAAVKEHRPKILGLSAMLTTTMIVTKDVIAALKTEKLYDNLVVMVGGAPVTEQFANSVGALYAADASTAVDVANAALA
ncbi:MAG: corrinoid protein [Negativicutes bacterium]|jgi:5-methyltetrahydrofolate--homocysteine methyltransferase